MIRTVVSRSVVFFKGFFLVMPPKTRLPGNNDLVQIDLSGCTFMTGRGGTF